MTTPAPVEKSALPWSDRIVLSPLPRLYVYEHCPFCARVRLALGVKNIKHELIWLANDDFDTPTSLIGKKAVPIFVPPDGKPMGESLDIVTFLNSDPRFGPTGSILPSSGRTDIDALFEDLADPLRRLTNVRFARTRLPEFTFREARDYYISRHQFKELPLEYDVNFEKSPEYIEAIQKKLPLLEDMIFSGYNVTEGGFSMDDITTFPKLRGLTIIKGLQLTPKIEIYVKYFGALAEIAQFDSHAS